MLLPDRLGRVKGWMFHEGGSPLLLVNQVNPMIEDTLPTAISLVLGTTDDAERWEGEDGTADLDVLSCLLKHGAWPTPRHLSLVVDGTGFEPSRKCFLDAICFATNPLLVGMTLSLQLADAADLGNEGHRRVSCFDSTLEGGVGGVVGPRKNLGYKGVFGENPDFCLKRRRSACTITMCPFPTLSSLRECVASLSIGTPARRGLDPRYRFPLNVLGWASSPRQGRCVLQHTYILYDGYLLGDVRLGNTLLFSVPGAVPPQQRPP